MAHVVGSDFQIEALQQRADWLAIGDDAGAVGSEGQVGQVADAAQIRDDLVRGESCGWF